MRNSKWAAIMAGAVFLAIALPNIAGVQQFSSDKVPLGTIRIEYRSPESGNTVAWDGPWDSRLYVQIDDNPPELFASGRPSTQVVTWFAEGHVYTFTLTNPGGTILATNRLDLR